MNVLAVDPGPHVGVATYDAEGNWSEFEETPERFYALVEPWVDMWADVVVCEDFFISGARDKTANQTIEMIGVLRFLCARYGKTFVTQSPTDAKTFSSAAKLQSLGWYKKAKADHARSATRHLVLYLARTGVLTERLLQSVPKEEG